MTESPRPSDREFTTTLDAGIRRRLGYSHRRGAVTRFVVQIEYRLDGEWTEVVRSDHDPGSVHGHDVEVEGVHVDAFRRGSMHSEPIAPPVPASVGLTIAEEQLNRHGERYVERFEQYPGGTHR